ncbi:MAG TPA: DUF1552 domain-containing protein [Tepidisphaeraceae bacterium]|nr:DUF1552 domain-containing protein [Tepidisphaeraceae bacterium]
MSTKWHIPRRTFLKGLGTALALPMLDAMLPSTRVFADVVGNTASGLPKRMAFIYVPQGKNMVDWTPKTFGADYELPMILQPLAEHRKDFSIVTGMAHMRGLSENDGGGDHARASAVYLTGCHPKKTAGADIKLGISVDQFAAQRIGNQTRLPSLELSCDGGQRAGSCDSGYSCAYQFNLSWKNDTMPVNPEVDPRLAFERLFGNKSSGQSAEARAKRMLFNKSVLDFVLDDAKRLQNGLGSTDTRKLDEYLNAVREIEQRIERSEKFRISAPPGAEEPQMFETYEQQIKLMFDILALSFQTDSTRIATFIVAHDGSNRPYPQIGISDGHHDLSHHRNDETKKAKIAKINHFHTTQFNYFLNKLKSIREGEGNLLDNSAIVYGSGISDGNQHLHTNLPVLVAGKCGEALKTGEHIKVDENTPMCNMYVSLLNIMGVKTDRFGDSTGRLKEIAGVA